MAVTMDPGIWAGALLTIFVFSFYIRDRPNILYKIAEKTIIGCSIGYIIVIAIAQNLYNLVIIKVIEGNIILIIPTLIGLLIYSRFTAKYTYLSRLPISFIIGTGIAVNLYNMIVSNIFNKTLIPLASYNFFGPNIVTNMSFLIKTIAVITSVFYFYFTGGKRLNEPPLSYILMLGRYMLLIYFGSSFGVGVLSRITKLVGREQFLLYDWLGLSP